MVNTLTNTLQVPIKVEIGRVTKKLTAKETDYTKNLVFRAIAELAPQQTLVKDSVFICTDNCETVLNAGDPEMEPIFFRISFVGKAKIDTNCRHVYVSTGLIPVCKEESKNYFNSKYHTRKLDKSGNTIVDYAIGEEDWKMAK